MNVVKFNRAHLNPFTNNQQGPFETRSFSNICLFVTFPIL